jgi:hypothetical protein
VHGATEQEASFATFCHAVAKVDGRERRLRSGGRSDIVAARDARLCGAFAADTLEERGAFTADAKPLQGDVRGRRWSRSQIVENARASATVVRCAPTCSVAFDADAIGRKAERVNRERDVRRHAQRHFAGVGDTAKHGMRLSTDLRSRVENALRFADVLVG